jgi:hypothetical protein
MSLVSTVYCRHRLDCTLVSGVLELTSVAGHVEWFLRASRVDYAEFVHSIDVLEVLQVVLFTHDMIERGEW